MRQRGKRIRHGPCTYSERSRLLLSKAIAAAFPSVPAAAAFSAFPLPEAVTHQVGEPLAGHPLDNPTQQVCAGDMPKLAISLASGSHLSMTVSTGTHKSSPLFGDDITRNASEDAWPAGVSHPPFRDEECTVGVNGTSTRTKCLSIRGNTLCRPPK